MIKTPFYFVLAEKKPAFALGSHQYFFERALTMAHSCMGLTHPNPNVGTVIVKDGQVIAEGATERAGCDHAEIVALKKAGKKAIGSTLYVTLEPCSHFGKTPPCTDAIINAGMSKVVFGAKDVNPQVCGQGIAALKNAGLIVEQIADRDLQERASAINAPFKKFILEKKPYLVAKLATTNDLVIGKHNGPLKITDAAANEVVHRLRRAHDAILVGANTAKVDNPRLNAREKNPLHTGQPCRIILSHDLSLPLHLQVLSSGASPTYIATAESSDSASEKALLSRGVRIIHARRSNGQLDLPEVFRKLGGLGMTTILIEPGAKLLASLLAQDLIDEFWWLKSPDNYGADGVSVAGLDEDLAKGHCLIHQGSLGRDSLKIFVRA